MKKKKEPETKNMDEFHKLNTKDAQGHLHYVCGKKGNKYESVGITHAPRTSPFNPLHLKRRFQVKPKEHVAKFHNFFINDALQKVGRFSSQGEAG